MNCGCKNNNDDYFQIGCLMANDHNNDDEESDETEGGDGASGAGGSGQCLYYYRMEIKTICG